MKTRRAFLFAVVIAVGAMSQFTRTQVTRIPGATPHPVADGSARAVGHMDPAQMLRLSLVLEPRDNADLERFLRDVQDPASPRFHRYLSFDQWKARYAPTDGDVAKTRAWARRVGLGVIHEFRNNLALKVEGNADTIEQAFGVRLNHYQTPTRHFFSNDHDPTMPAELIGILKDVQGLNSYYQVQAMSQPAGKVNDDQPIYRGGPFIASQSAARSGSGHGGPDARRDASATSIDQGAISGTFGGLEYADLYSSEAYDLAGLQRFSQCCNPTNNPGGSPKETSIAIIGQNSINMNDLQTFAANYGMAFNLTQVMINGPSCCDDEMTLDIESATAMANSFGSFLNTAHVYAYEGGGSHLGDLLDAWDSAHSDDNARNASTSFGKYEDGFGGVGDPSISDFTDIINAMAAEGWSMVAASGDHGAYDDCQTLSVSFPASSPNVTAMGGTTLTLTNNGGQPKFGGLTAWTGNGCGGSSWPGSNNGGGGGGCASTEPAGFWQAVGPALCSKRSVPDIALNAGMGVQIYYGSWQSVGGTSAAAPEFSGFMAHLNSYLLWLGNICGSGNFTSPCAPFGNLNPAMWLMANAGRAPNGHAAFYDINDGSCNGGSQGNGYCTSAGYDLATGWGSVNMLQLGWGLIDVVTHGTRPDVAFNGPATNTWYKNDQVVKFTIVAANPQGTSASVRVAGHTAQWDGAVADVTSHSTPGSGDSFYDGPAKTSASSLLLLSSAGLGCHTAHVRGWDNAGQVTDDETYGPICWDPIPPTVSCKSADGLWHANDVGISCVASDIPLLSGLANPADASFSLVTSVPVGTETNNALTNNRSVCDNATNCVTAGPIGGNMIDKKAPSIAIIVPAATQYIVNQPIASNYGCADGGSGVATCAGPVANGSNIDTASVGTKTFTVNAADNVANPSSQSVNYDVTYRICLQYDPNQATNGRAKNISLQLCDYNNANVSMVSIQVTATAVDGDPAKAKPLGALNPGNLFLYGPGSAPGASYLYVLDTQGLGVGSHVLSFKVQGDPIVHSAPFTLKN
jgi:hypothetical protein